MSAAGPPQGRPRAWGEAQARRARPRAWMAAESDTLRMTVRCNEAANCAPSGGSAAAALANEAASVGVV
jgi:hypothetical protein